MTDKQIRNTLIALLAVLVFTIGGYWFYNQPDRRSDNQKLGDALSDISKGFSNANKEFDNKTIGQRVHDDVKTASENIKHDVKGDDDQNTTK